MGERDDYEFFDPRRLPGPDAEERITGTAAQPDLTEASLKPNHPFKPAPEVALPVKEFRGSDLYYHRLAADQTPMPEAWLAFIGGLIMLAAIWLKWTNVPLNGNARASVTALDLGSLGLLLTAGAAVTAVAGLAGVVLRRGRLALLGWMSGLGPAIIVAWLAPRLYQGDYMVRVGELLHETKGVGPGLALFGLGAVIAVLASLWASGSRVGR